MHSTTGVVHRSLISLLRTAKLYDARFVSFGAPMYTLRTHSINCERENPLTGTDALVGFKVAVDCAVMMIRSVQCPQNWLSVGSHPVFNRGTHNDIDTHG
jgi:hypothetical protein